MAGPVPCLRRVEYICRGTAGQRRHEGDDGGSAGGAERSTGREGAAPHGSDCE